MLNKFNRFLRKISPALNIINILLGIIIGIAYVYLPFLSIGWLIFGIITAISCALSMGISYYFTAAKSNETDKDKTKYKNTPTSNRFIIFAIPVTLLTTVSNFFYSYTGNILLIQALALPFTPALTAGISLGLAIFIAGSMLVSHWLQIHYIWESLRERIIKPQPIPIIHINLTTPNPGKTQRTYKINLPKPSPLPIPQSSKNSASLSKTSFLARVAIKMSNNSPSILLNIHQR